MLLYPESALYGTHSHNYHSASLALSTSIRPTLPQSILLLVFLSLFLELQMHFLFGPAKFNHQHQYHKYHNHRYHYLPI